MQAERCRSVAETIDLRRAAVIDRHQPVLALHLEEIWMGRAARASRAKLQHVIGAALYSLGRDLAITSRALRGEAGSLEQEAAALRRRGRALDEAEARAAHVLAQRAGSGHRDG